MEPEYTNIAQLLNNIIEDDEKLKLIFSDQIQLFEYSNNSVNDNNIDESSLFQKKQALQTKVKELDLELNNLRKLGTNTADDNILTTPLKQNSWLAEMNYDQFKDKIGRFIQFFEKCFLPHLDKVKVTKEEEDVDGDSVDTIFQHVANCNELIQQLKKDVKVGFELSNQQQIVKNCEIILSKIKQIKQLN